MIANASSAEYALRYIGRPQRSHSTDTAGAVPLALLVVDLLAVALLVVDFLAVDLLADDLLAGLAELVRLLELLRFCAMARTISRTRRPRARGRRA